MLTQNNVISLLVNGVAHQFWKSYEIDSDLLTPADGFDVSLGVPPDMPVPDLINAGDKVKVLVGEDVVLTGVIDSVSSSVAKNGRQLSVHGRDDAAILLDCSAPIFNAKDMSLKEIIDKLVKPLGITKVRIDADKTTATKKVQIEPGMRAWDALAEFCESNGVWPWFEPDGTLVIGGPDYTTEPVADLVIRFNGDNNNVEQLRFEQSVARRYSEVTVLGQSNSGKHNIKATAKDAGISVYRPLTVVEGDIDSVAQAEKRARKIISDSRLDALTITIIVKGHRTEDGVLWAAGQRINLLSEPDGLEATYFLIARKFTMSENDAPRTELTLKEDGAWVLDAKPSKAKKAKGKKKGKRKGKKKGKTGESVPNVDIDIYKKG